MKLKEKTKNFKSGLASARPSRDGFTLLMSVLIASIVLSIGLGIAGIVLKQILLTSSSKESQFAFYSADSGIECALFHDIQNGFFPTSTDSGVPGSGVNCNGQDIATTWSISATSLQAVTTFSFNFSPQPHCVTVVVTKDGDTTRIESRGYNTCDTSNPRRVERAIRATY